MSGKSSLPSPEQLRAEREHAEVEVAQGRVIIAKSRASITGLRQHFADSFDRLAESQKLVRRP
jgi:hypothetical protein